MALGVISFTISVNCSVGFEFDRPSDRIVSSVVFFFIAINILTRTKIESEHLNLLLMLHCDLLRNVLHFIYTAKMHYEMI